MSKKTLTIVFIVAIIVIVIAVIIYVFRCNIFPKLSSCVTDPNKDGTPVPPGYSGGSWMVESFPLNVGMYGPQIKVLQSALGITSDGRFGNQTAAAIKAKGKNIPLSKTDYDSLVGSSGTTGSVIGKSAYAKSQITAIFIDDSATNPTFLKYVQKDAFIGTVKSQSGTWYLLEGGNLKVPVIEVYLK